MNPDRPEFDPPENAPAARLDEANRRALAAESELARLRDELERRVAERTAELAAANDALRASEGRLRGFFDTATVAMLEIDPDARFLRVNAAFYRMFGFTPDALPGLSIRDVVYPEDWPRVWADFSRVVRGERVAYDADRRYRRKDGSPLHARVSVVAGGGSPDAPTVMSTVVIDLTERRRLEEELRQAGQLEAVGRLAGGVAHDFNNLLTVVNGYADELLAAAPPDDPRRDALAAIRDAGARAAALTGQLLAFGRKSIVEPRVLDLNATVDGLTGLLGRAVGPGVVLAVALAPELHRVKADPTQMEQVVANLAMNARDAMPDGGRLVIETANVQLSDGAVPDLPPGPYVRVAVSDTGRGIPEDVLPHVFEPFFATGSSRGTGLGLATVYGIAKAHGGHAAAVSTPGGSTFAVLLPATLERPAPRSGELRLGPRGSETVLIAEDDDTIRRLIRTTLEANGYAVLDGGFGPAALRAADGHAGTIHLLVSDLMMPGLNGRELADALRARRPGVKVLYVSGYTDDADVRSAIESAADAFLPKPFAPLALAAKVRAVLDGG